mmetsp:Transcript_186/g.485  ORF Transcript_186/g.485 Transcript_186/m.485 type:complete len:140 (-) Transcript_186:284-703(-)
MDACVVDCIVPKPSGPPRVWSGIKAKPRASNSAGAHALQKSSGLAVAVALTVEPGTVGMGLAVNLPNENVMHARSPSGSFPQNACVQSFGMHGMTQRNSQGGGDMLQFASHDRGIATQARRSVFFSRRPFRTAGCRRCM